jgi:hypothetical protein
MRKKLTALIALAAFLFLFAPGLSSAEKKTVKYDFRIFFKKSLTFIASIADYITPVFYKGKTDTPRNTVTDDSNLKAKPLGGLDAPRPSIRD